MRCNETAFEISDCRLRAMISGGIDYSSPCKAPRYHIDGLYDAEKQRDMKLKLDEWIQEPRALIVQVLKKREKMRLLEGKTSGRESWTTETPRMQAVWNFSPELQWIQLNSYYAQLLSSYGVWYDGSLGFVWQGTLWYDSNSGGGFGVPNRSTIEQNRVFSQRLFEVDAKPSWHSSHCIRTARTYHVV